MQTIGCCLAGGGGGGGSGDSAVAAAGDGDCAGFRLIAEIFNWNLTKHL